MRGSGEAARFSVDTTLCGVHLKNRVLTASGTYKFAESGKFYDPCKLGAVTTKGVSARGWDGNGSPRVAETPAGLLNSIGLENPGVEAYIEEELKPLKAAGAVVIANIAGHSEDEYAEVAERLAATEVDILELNISCPNVNEGGIAFGTDAKAAAALTTKVKKASGTKPLFVKLSPNVADITVVAKAVAEAGADGLSLINTLIGMKIDIGTGKPLLANGIGGLSGPAIHPIAVRMVYEVRNALPKMPLIGMGGILGRAFLTS